MMGRDSKFRFTYAVLSKADVGAAFRKIAIFLLAFTFFLLGCESKSSQKAPVTQAPKDALEIVLTYGSEKEKWITEVTDKFNREDHRTNSAKRIFRHAFSLGSDEGVNEGLSRNRQS